MEEHHPPDANVTLMFLFVCVLKINLVISSHLITRIYFLTSGSGFAEVGFLV